jgi:CDP-diacylglycerol---glycerol-3-phosphate 3-phosphatidyltransferase
MEANIPNSLTVSRIVATAVVCALVMIGTPFGNGLALATYLYACITDFLDGYLARMWRQQSSFGRVLDPIADKLLVASALLVLVGVDRLQGVHLIPAVVILWREILVSGLREFLAHLRVGMPVTRLAKWKTTLQMVALGFLIIGDAGPAVGEVTSTTIGIIGLWAAAALTLFTGYDYVRAGLRHMGDGDVETGAPAERPAGPCVKRADPARDPG